MLVVHMDSGLGNQMLDYAEYLAIQRSNPDEECYLENIIYEIPEKEGMFSMWNGYELEKIFGIHVPNIKEKFSEEQWEAIRKSVEKSEFWKENWNYAPYIVKAFREQGLGLNDFGARKGNGPNAEKSVLSMARSLITAFFTTPVGYHLKRYLRLLMQKKLIRKKAESYNIYRKYPTDSYVGHSFAFKYKGFGIEKINKEIKEAFRFPIIQDEKNLEILQYIKSHETVSIHARRSDLLFLNGHCYRHGFFKRSVRYIRKKVKNPVFVFFTDENSQGWCEENAKIFGLDLKKDQVRFVTWNKGEDSFRDMQLMAQCKHNIFTESTFGFWGAYLNENPDKITCAPDVTILATNTF